MIHRRKHRRAAANPLYVMAASSLVVLAGLLFILFGGLGGRSGPAGSARELLLYCAAGVRVPMEQIAADYLAEYNVKVDLNYGGSNTLLNQIQVSRVGDLYLAADDSYTTLAREKGLVDEILPIAAMRPVIAVASGNPKKIVSIGDLLRDDVRVALGNPDQAAIGRTTRRLLKETGNWDALHAHVTTSGVFKPTVPELANDVKLGTVDAAVIWDAVAAQYPEIEAVRTSELDAGTAHITIGVLSGSKDATAALRFARYVAARDRGLKTFKEHGYEPVDGDIWAEVPELTFFAGAVNRKAVQGAIESFRRREGVEINTVYNGCGILTAQMRAMMDNHDGVFPDVYMACDVYYLETVAQWFQDAVNVSNTDIVIAVQDGNPKGIVRLDDLAKPGVRVALGQPEQCTIGVLSRRLLQSEGLYERVLNENVVTQSATSALLIPNITTGSADAALVYATDARAEADKLETIRIDSPLARAVQPYSIARSSDFKYLGRRLFETIARSREAFEAAGFVWRLDGGGAEGSRRAANSVSGADSAIRGQGAR